MRTLLTIPLIALALMLAAPLSHADSRLFVGIPLGFDFDGDIKGAADSSSGFTVGWGFPFHLGLGYTSISADAEDKVNLSTTSVDYTLVDVFTFFRAYMVDWQIGYGKGDAEVEPFTIGANSYEVDKADATQWFVTAGLPLGKSFAVHLGYHSISAESPTSRENGVNVGPYLLDGSSWTLGFQYIMD